MIGLAGNDIDNYRTYKYDYTTYNITVIIELIEMAQQRQNHHGTAKFPQLSYFGRLDSQI